MNMAGPSATGILIALGGLLEQQYNEHPDTSHWRQEAIQVYKTAFETILHLPPPPSSASSSSSSSTETYEHAHHGAESTWERLTDGQKQRLLGLSQKLGDLYAMDRDDDEAAERYYAWSLMHVMRASQKPTTNTNDTLMQLPKWTNNTDFAACLETLARFYSERGLYARAIPIYELTLRRLPIASDDCRVSSILCHLADAAVGVGNLVKAKQCTEQGLQVARRGRGGLCQTMRGALLFNRALILHMQGDEIGAKIAFTEAEKFANYYGDESVAEACRQARIQTPILPN
ncbi:hypothetical protein BDF19DRAFT_456090 [Syncephalis fuscata]|nr:hypothetical protein BDF19DRAFT_456090 [Syncephalis fuscata]